MRASGNFWLDGIEPSAPVRPSGDTTAEVAVIGGGLTGLSAALRLAGDHHADVVVLEARTPGWGASGRNAGMVVPSVGKLSIGQRLERWGPDATRASGRLGVRAVERVRELIDVEGIDCDVADAGWLQVAHRPEAAAGLPAAAQAYRDALGIPGVEHLDRHDLAEQGYLRAGAHGALRIRPAFGIHPRRFVEGLATAVAARGARIFTETPVMAWERGGGVHRLATPAGTVTARRVVVATDAYTPDGLHPYFHGRLLPISGAILVTRPLSDREWATVGLPGTEVFTDTRRVLFYWRRLPDGRLLFGGRGPAFGSRPSPERHRRWLERRCAALLPGLEGVGSECYWQGAISLSYDRVPHVTTLDEDRTVAFAMCYLGTGIALSTLWGAAAADLLVGEQVPRDTPMVSTGLRRFPLPALRPLYFNGSRLAYETLDRLGR